MFLSGGSHTRVMLKLPKKNHLWLTLGYERGDGAGRCIKTDEKNHLWLVFGCKGGGGGGRHIKTDEKTTSSSHLDARKVVVVGDASKQQK